MALEPEDPPPASVVCTACGHTALPGAGFCSECGAAIQERCARCGRGVPEHVHFCPFCGAIRAASADAVAPVETAPNPEVLHGERRNATVLFSDLAGYSELNQQLDPEEVAQLMNRLKLEAGRVIDAHDGIVNQFVGDEVMALFGVPRAHEDDPMRAVSAALELRDRVQLLSEELVPGLEMSLRLHGAVNTGLMIIQHRDRREGIYCVTGEAINTGARLANQAKGDEILVGPDTLRAIQDHFETEPVGSLELKGCRKGLLIHRVLGATPARQLGRCDLQSPASTGFVGRAAELATLAQCFAETRRGRGRPVGVAGEPGLGKSRLLAEFAHSLSNEALVLEGHCHGHGNVAPYQPFRDVLREVLLGGSDAANAGAASELERVAARLQRELPGCADHLPVLLDLLSLHPDSLLAKPTPHAGGQQAILAAITDVLAALARSRPVVLLLSDWHCADAASEQALSHLTEELAGQQLMLVVDFRSHYCPRWEREALRVDLAPLSAEETHSLVRQILGAGATEALARRVFERTGGNPLFVEELCSALADLRSTRGVDPEQQVESLVPANVAAVLRARVDHLSAGGVELLKRASVIGESFPLDLLREICEPDVGVDVALEELLRSGLLQHRGEADLLHFKHALVHDVAYEMLLLRSRRKLHGVVARAIERREEGRLHERLELLAHHFTRSNHHDEAVRYLVRSADKAVAAGAMGQGLDRYVEAVRILERMPETAEQMRCRVDTTLKLANAAIYRPSKELRDVLRSCLELSERLGDDRAERRSLYWMGWLEHALGQWSDARRHFERCIPLAESHDDRKLVSLLYSNLGQTLFHCGDYVAARELLERAVTLRRSISGGYAGPSVISYSLGYLAMIDAEAGRFDRALERLDEADALGRESGQIQIEAALATQRALVALFRGEWAACRNAAGELARKNERIGSTYMQAMSLALGGYARCFDGEPAEGELMLREGIDTVERVGIDMNLSFLYACLGEVLALGDGSGVDEAESLAECALHHVERGDRMGEPPAHRVRLLVALHRAPDAVDRIERALDEAIAAARRRGSLRDEAIATLRAAEGRAEHDPAWARPRLRDCAQRLGALGMDWYASRARTLQASLG